jgi:hypothetical protein
MARRWISRQEYPLRVIQLLWNLSQDKDFGPEDYFKIGSGKPRVRLLPAGGPFDHGGEK